MATKYWVGGSGYWTQASRWNDGTVPQPGDDVVFDQDLNDYKYHKWVAINTDISLNSIEVKDNWSGRLCLRDSILSYDPGVNVTINDYFEVHCELEDNGDSQSVITIGGSFFLERHKPGGPFNTKVVLTGATPPYRHHFGLLYASNVNVEVSGGQYSAQTNHRPFSLQVGAGAKFVVVRFQILTLFMTWSQIDGDLLTLRGATIRFYTLGGDEYLPTNLNCNVQIIHDEYAFDCTVHFQGDTVIGGDLVFSHINVPTAFNFHHDSDYGLTVHGKIEIENPFPQKLNLVIGDKDWSCKELVQRDGKFIREGTGKLVVNTSAIIDVGDMVLESPEDMLYDFRRNATINGNITVKNTSLAEFSIAQNYTLTVNGDIVVEAGGVRPTSGYGTIRVRGDYTDHTVDNWLPEKLGNLIVDGNLSLNEPIEVQCTGDNTSLIVGGDMNMNGGKLLFSRGSSAVKVHITGDFVLDSGADIIAGEGASLLGTLVVDGDIICTSGTVITDNLTDTGSLPHIAIGGDFDTTGATFDFSANTDSVVLFFGSGKTHRLIPKGLSDDNRFHTIEVQNSDSYSRVGRDVSSALGKLIVEASPGGPTHIYGYVVLKVSRADVQFGSDAPTSALEVEFLGPSDMDVHDASVIFNGTAGHGIVVSGGDIPTMADTYDLTSQHLVASYTTFEGTDFSLSYFTDYDWEYCVFEDCTLYFMGGKMFRTKGCVITATSAIKGILDANTVFPDAMVFSPGNVEDAIVIGSDRCAVFNSSDPATIKLPTKVKYRSLVVSRDHDATPGDYRIYPSVAYSSDIPRTHLYDKKDDVSLLDGSDFYADVDGRINNLYLGSGFGKLTIGTGTGRWVQLAVDGSFTNDSGTAVVTDYGDLLINPRPGVRGRKIMKNHGELRLSDTVNRTVTRPRIIKVG